jgi:hypothetical protein
MKGKFDAQLRALQADEAFLDRCAHYYQQGYKDWHILSAIANFLIVREERRRGLDLRNPQDRERSRFLYEELKEVVIPPDEFEGPGFELAYKMHALTCLTVYGFEARIGVMPDMVMKFLRERMRHFDLDIPHKPMFGKPPAGWPDL